MNSGYCGYSMSVNAAKAYDAGEMPLSKWTKAAILDACGDKADMLSKLTVAELKSTLLYKSSWHHTSKMFNCTDFYELDEYKLDELTQADVDSIIASRKPRQPRKPKAEPKTIVAEIRYTYWYGSRNYRKHKDVTEVVTFLEGDKVVQTSNGNKRMTSIIVLRKIEERIDKHE